MMRLESGALSRCDGVVFAHGCEVRWSVGVFRSIRHHYRFSSIESAEFGHFRKDVKLKIEILGRVQV